jgi:hypothetical protein
LPPVWGRDELCPASGLLIQALLHRRSSIVEKLPPHGPDQASTATFGRYLARRSADRRAPTPRHPHLWRLHARADPRRLDRGRHRRRPHDLVCHQQTARMMTQAGSGDPAIFARSYPVAACFTKISDTVRAVTVRVSASAAHCACHANRAFGRTHLVDPRCVAAGTLDSTDS